MYFHSRLLNSRSLSRCLFYIFTWMSNRHLVLIRLKKSSERSTLKIILLAVFPTSVNDSLALLVPRPKILEPSLPLLFISCLLVNLPAKLEKYNQVPISSHSLHFHSSHLSHHHLLPGLFQQLPIKIPSFLCSPFFVYI